MTDTYFFFGLNKLDVKLDVTPNRLEKYMAFFLNKNLGFIDSMLFMNSSLEKLVKNLSDDNFKYLTKEFGSKDLELLKQNGTYPYKYMDSCKRSNEKKLPAKKCFNCSVKDGTTDDNGKKLDSHINDEDSLTRKKIWNECNRKNMGDYHNYYLKKDVLLSALMFLKSLLTRA